MPVVGQMAQNNHSQQGHQPTSPHAFAEGGGFPISPSVNLRISVALPCHECCGLLQPRPESSEHSG